MPKKRQPADFVKWLEHQFRAFRARRFEQLDVKALGEELESVVGKYGHEVRHRAERIIPILMKRQFIYGDKDDLRFEWEMLCEALSDSPSLAKTASTQIKQAYRFARARAEFHDEGGWPARCPWPTLEALGRAVRARQRAYRALGRAGLL